MATSGSLTVKISLVLLIIGLIIFVIGFAAPYWNDAEFRVSPGLIEKYYYEGRRHFGLWTHCDVYERWDATIRSRKVGRVQVDECYAILTERPYRLSSELQATQFFETMGLIGVVVAFILLMVSMCVDSCKERRVLPIISAIICLASAGSIILGAVIFGSADIYSSDLSWAFGLTIVGGVIFVITGVLVLIGAIINK